MKDSKKTKKKFTLQINQNKYLQFNVNLYLKANNYQIKNLISKLIYQNILQFGMKSKLNHNKIKSKFFWSKMNEYKMKK